jgi:hypothetical protein
MEMRRAAPSPSVTEQAVAGSLSHGDLLPVDVEGRGPTGSVAAAPAAKPAMIAVPAPVAARPGQPEVTREVSADSAGLSVSLGSRGGGVGAVGQGIGTGHGRLGGAQTAPQALRTRADATQVTGALPAEVAQRMLPPVEKPTAGDPYSGKFQVVMHALARGDTEGALGVASRWHREAPGDVLSVVALGEAVEAAGDVAKAMRVNGSIIDLFPARADLRRFAGARVERLRSDAALALAEDSYEKAEAERPDHPSSHRSLAFARLRQGRYADAFDAARVGIARKYPLGRFPGVDRILREDLGLIAAAWIKADPAKRESILDALHAAGGRVENAPSIRFVLSWETDANDVDFHIFDDRGGHAFYSRKHLASGGDLYADVTTGYGPECFTIRQARGQRAAKYTLQANYYSRGPMGYGMGKLEIIDHDGEGGLSFEERPYVVMKDRAFVDLGTVTR